MTTYPHDIYTEPADIDVHTLRNLGPLTGMAGIWEGSRSLDINPKPSAPMRQEFVERIELQPIDPQTNGPQLLYGLRYYTHIVKPGEIENRGAQAMPRRTGRDRLFTLCRSTWPRICTMIFVWNGAAYSSLGPCPRAPRSIRR